MILKERKHSDIIRSITLPLFFLACSILFTTRNRQYIASNLNQHTVASSETERNPASKVFPLTPEDLGWRAAHNVPGEWIEVILPHEMQSYAVIASITMDVAINNLQQKAWIIAYELHSNSEPIKNPATGANTFKGNSIEVPQKFNALWPQFLERLRLVPKWWFNEIALRWQLVFTSRKCAIHPKDSHRPFPFYPSLEPPGLNNVLLAPSVQLEYVCSFV